MPKHLIAPCGRETNSKGRWFNPFTLKQHIQDCKNCQAGLKTDTPRIKYQKPVWDPMTSTDPMGLLDDDLPDGAYWALHGEYYGWP